MGRTIESATQLIITAQNALAKFRRGLRKDDQLAFDDLFRAARRQVAAISYAAHLVPFESMLLAMLIEEHQRVLRLEKLLGIPMEQNADAIEWLDPGRLSLGEGDDDMDDRH